MSAPSTVLSMGQHGSGLADEKCRVNVWAKVVRTDAHTVPKDMGALCGGAHLSK